VYRDAVAAVVREMEGAAGGLRKLGRLGGLDPARLVRLKQGQAHELEPATFRALYQVCARRAAVAHIIADRLEADERPARGVSTLSSDQAGTSPTMSILDWRRRLDAAVTRPVDRADPPAPDPPRVISFEKLQLRQLGPGSLKPLFRLVRQAVENPEPRLETFLERVARHQRAPIPDAWPRNQWVRVPERATAGLGYYGMLIMTPKDGEHYALLLWEPRQK